jgi:hypothetical protein
MDIVSGILVLFLLYYIIAPDGFLPQDVYDFPFNSVEPFYDKVLLY